MTTKFEVGKEYVNAPGDLRMIVGAVNEWGASFEYTAGEFAGQFGNCPHSVHGWRPAPRTVTRWIVVRDTGESYTLDEVEKADAFVSSCRPGTAIANGPFPCVAP